MTKNTIIIYPSACILQCQVAAVAVLFSRSIVIGWVVKWRGLPVESIMPLSLGRLVVGTTMYSSLCIDIVGWMWTWQL